MNKNQNIVIKRNEKQKKDINHKKKKINLSPVDKFEDIEIKKKNFSFKFLNLFLIQLYFFYEFFEMK